MGLDNEKVVEKFLLKPKHWRAAREIVSMMPKVEEKITRQFWFEVSNRLKRKIRGIKPEHYHEDTFKGFWTYISNWPEFLFLDVGQAAESRKQYIYYELGGEVSDTQVIKVLEKIRKSDLKDELKFYKAGEYQYTYREYTPTLEPQDWPMYGKKAMMDLAEDVAMKCMSFIDDVAPLIRGGKR